MSKIITGNSAATQSQLTADQKWQELKTQLLEGIHPSKHEMMSKLFDNQRKHVAGYLKENKNLFENAAGAVAGNPSVSTGNLAILPKLTIPMIKRIIPNTIASEFVGVQPLQGPSGMVFSMRWTYQGMAGKGGTDGSNIFTKNSAVNPMYMADPTTFFDETVNPNAYDGTWTDQSYNIGDEVFGSGVKKTGPGAWAKEYNRLAKRFYSGGMSGGTPSGYAAFPYQNTTGGYTDPWFGGDVDFGYAKGPFDTLEGQVGNQLGLETLRQEVSAGTRKLSARWTPEAQMDLQYMNGLDMQSELSTVLEAQVLHEIDNELINDIMGLPDASNIRVVDLSSVGPFSPTSVIDVYANLGPIITQVSNNIARRTKRFAANRMLLSPNLVSVLQSGSRSVFAPTLQGTFDSPENNKFIGMLNNQIKCYSYLSFDSETIVDGTGNPYGYDPIILAYKGNGEADAGMFYCPYQVLSMMPVVTDPNTFEQVIQFVTRYGKVKFTNPNTSLGNSGDYYGKIIVKGIYQYA